MLQNIILKFEKTKKLFKKQTFQMDWFIGLLEKLYLAKFYLNPVKINSKITVKDLYNKC